MSITNTTTSSAASSKRMSVDAARSHALSKADRTGAQSSGTGPAASTNVLRTSIPVGTTMASASAHARTPSTETRQLRTQNISPSPTQHMQLEAFTPGRTIVPGANIPGTIASVTNNERRNNNSEDEGSALTSSQSALYNPTEPDLAKEEAVRKKQLNEYVRHYLFPYWKFFTSPKQLVFNNKSGSIMVKICNNLNVATMGRMTWWELNKEKIVESLNRKRSDVTAYLKKEFIRK